MAVKLQIKVERSLIRRPRLDQVKQNVEKLLHLPHSTAFKLDPQEPIKVHRVVRQGRQKRCSATITLVAEGFESRDRLERDREHILGKMGNACLQSRWGRRRWRITDWDILEDTPVVYSADHRSERVPSKSPKTQAEEPCPEPSGSCTTVANFLQAFTKEFPWLSDSSHAILTSKLSPHELLGLQVEMSNAAEKIRIKIFEELKPLSHFARDVRITKACMQSPNRTAGKDMPTFTKSPPTPEQEEEFACTSSGLGPARRIPRPEEIPALRKLVHGDPCHNDVFKDFAKLNATDEDESKSKRRCRKMRKSVAQQSIHSSLRMRPKGMLRRPRHI